MRLFCLGLFLCIVKIVISKDCHFTIIQIPLLNSIQNLFRSLNTTHIFDARLLNSVPYLVTPLSEASLKAIINKTNSSWLPNLEVHKGIAIESKYIPKRASLDQKFAKPFQDDDNYTNAAISRARTLKRELNFNDPVHAWQLLNDGEVAACPTPGFDINVYPVYKAGFTGKGVKIIIVDDAVDTSNVDLKPNLDINFTDDLLDTKRVGPRGTDSKMLKNNGHGTEVAGLAAAAANNSHCSFGVAYGATLGGIRLLGDKVTDLMVGEALIRFASSVQIYISSWGPTDDGKTFRMPKKFMNMALHYSSGLGNKGKGALFFFPAGNGGNNKDNCGADGFVNHHNIVAVTAVGHEGSAPAFAERCAAVSIAVPLGGSNLQSQYKLEKKNKMLSVPTTAINNKCTDQFIGTSAANPIAAGAVALAMEANPNMTSRDIHALLSFSGRIPSSRNMGWYVNGAGMLVSHMFGAGMLDAARMVNLALKWKNLGPIKLIHLKQGKLWEQRIVERKSYTKLMSKYVRLKNIYPGKAASLTFAVIPSNYSVEVLEMPLLHLQWVHDKRGALKVELTSPSGLTAVVLGTRSSDRFKGPSEMMWKSLLHTGECPYGIWRAKIIDTRRRRSASGPSGFIRYAELKLHGTDRNESAFIRNAEIITPTWHPLQNEARKKHKSHKLTKKEVKEVFEFQRWRALKEDVTPKRSSN